MLLSRGDGVTFALGSRGIRVDEDEVNITVKTDGVPEIRERCVYGSWQKEICR
jgi:hypothetical protein